MTYKIYCDESRQTNYQYMVLGGIITPFSNFKIFDSKIDLLRKNTNMHAELKWTKVTDQKLNEYKDFVDLLFNLIDANKIHFHSLIINNSLVDHKKYNKGNKEIGFYKFFYQLLIHCFGKLYCREGENDKFIVIFDHRTTKYSLNNLKDILNNGICKRYKICYNPFRSVESSGSKGLNLLQIVDIIIGAIGFQKNGLNTRKDTRKSKILLSNYISRKAGLKDLTNNTPWGKQNFTIWNFRLRT